MPVSKSKRKRRGRRRPPSVQTPPKRKRTPRYVPYAFFIAMGAGVVMIILNYLPLWEFRNSILFIGLGLMGFAFLVATRWH